MSSSIPNLGDLALNLESRLVAAVAVGPACQEISAEIAETVANAQLLDLVSLLAWARALHAAAAICLARGEEDGLLLHDMAQRLIGTAFDALALTALPIPEGTLRH